MPNWLIYSADGGPLGLPSVFVQLANMPPLTIPEQVETICVLIADQQQGNPLGLFQHPESHLETQLSFFQCNMIYHEKAAALLEAMYEYCNSPLHLSIEIDAEQGVSAGLEHLLEKHKLPFVCGGLIDETRGVPSCCIVPMKPI